MSLHPQCSVSLSMCALYGLPENNQAYRFRCMITYQYMQSRIELLIFSITVSVQKLVGQLAVAI